MWHHPSLLSIILHLTQVPVLDGQRQKDSCPRQSTREYLPWSAILFQSRFIGRPKHPGVGMREGTPSRLRIREILALHQPWCSLMSNGHNQQEESSTCPWKGMKGEVIPCTPCRGHHPGMTPCQGQSHHCLLKMRHLNKARVLDCCSSHVSCLGQSTAAPGT